MIYDLRFDCRYIIKVLSVSTLGLKGRLTTAEFPTPSCSEVAVTGPIDPDCPTNSEYLGVGNMILCSYYLSWLLVSLTNILLYASVVMDSFLFLNGH